MHEENFVSSWLKEDGAKKEERRLKMGKENKEERDKREEEKERNKRTKRGLLEEDV